MLVLNKRHGPQPGIFVGRPTVWGNPFKVGVLGRDWAVAQFRAYAIERLQREPTWLDPLRRASALVCFCAPQPCHADVLVELIEATGG